MSKQNAPYVVRWRNGVMDDPNPALTWRALAAAMALTRYADVKTGHNCFPGAPKCARIMRVSVDTIQRGWAELVEAGWLETRHRGEGLSSLKLLRWPKSEPTADSGTSEGDLPPTAATPTADSGPTFPGNQPNPSGPPGPRGGQEAKRPRAGRPEGWNAEDVAYAKEMGLVCQGCNSLVGFFTTREPLCTDCLEDA